MFEHNLIDRFIIDLTQNASFFLFMLTVDSDHVNLWYFPIFDFDQNKMLIKIKSKMASVWQLLLNEPSQNQSRQISALLFISTFIFYKSEVKDSLHSILFNHINCQLINGDIIPFNFRLPSIPARIYSDSLGENQSCSFNQTARWSLSCMEHSSQGCSKFFTYFSLRVQLAMT